MKNEIWTDKMHKELYPPDKPAKYNNSLKSKKYKEYYSVREKTLKTKFR